MTSLPIIQLNDIVQNTREEFLALLREGISLASVSGREGAFTRLIHRWALDHAFETDIWQSSEAQLEGYGQSSQPHIPLAGRETLVIRLRGHSRDGNRVIFNAHADVVPAGDIRNWSVDPWSGEYKDGRVYGRGACDAKGPLVGGLWAMLIIKNILPGGLAGDLMLELVPGEENCVGIGTLTSVVRGYRGDGAIVLEPTDNQPHCASRGGIRFEISCRGRASHGTTKWLGKDAIVMMRKALDSIDLLERIWNSSNDDELFDTYPIARPITVDSIYGGEWRGLVCDLCRCAGYIELLPQDDMGKFKKAFAEHIENTVDKDGIEISFGEEYPGYRTATEEPFCRAAEESVREQAQAGEKQPTWKGWTGFNSGCEAGIRAELFKTPTLVWGPGSIGEAHAADESISFEDVEVFTKLVVMTLAKWSK